MKKIKRLFLSIIGFVFYSCQTEAIYDIEDVVAEISIAIPYLENPNARYRIDYGQVQVIDSLPFVNKNGVTYQFNTNKSVLLKEKNLNEELKIWRYQPNGTQILESTIPINFNDKRKIQLLQFADNSNLSLFEPINPPSDQRTQTNTQFFYADNNQPPQVNVTILAVDSFALLLASGQNPNNVSADKKREIKTITLNKGVLSEIVTLDLNLFKQANGLQTIFLCKITDAQTNTILQNYGTNNATTVNSQIIIPSTSGEPSSTRGINPVNKFTLFQWKYNSPTTPFKANLLINGDKW
jgi:hypothetical protein